MRLFQIIRELEAWAPTQYQESYDNSGLIIGSSQAEITKALITLDVTEDVISEAIEQNCNLIIAHHPILFTPIKRLTGSNYVERVIIKAIKADIAIYAIHTNLDNIHTGVNAILAQKLGLSKYSILKPIQGGIKKLITYVPTTHADQVRGALTAAGGGAIGEYSECTFSTEGIGTFKGSLYSNPAIGSPIELTKVSEVKIELIFAAHLEYDLIAALKSNHPYEEVAYDIITIENHNQTIGSGMIGDLNQPLSQIEALDMIKQTLGLTALKYAGHKDMIKRIAVCGGSGSFLRKDAIRAGADMLITSDFKYHEWFDHEEQMVFVDVGHYESEQFVPQLIFDYLRKNALSLQAQISRVPTNPVKIY